MKSHKILYSTIGLVLVLIIGAAYLLVNVMRINPLRGTYTVTVTLDRSGGLQPGNDVTLRGFRVGKVDSIELINGGSAIAATAEIDDRYDIAVDTVVAVQALSAAGEQYIDFRPGTDQGPFLTDGSVIEYNPDTVHTPTPVWAVLDDTSALIAQIDPKHFDVILNELDIALSGGPDQLRSLIDGVSLVAAGLDSLLPQTANLITNLRTIASTTSMAQPDLGTLTRNSGVLFEQFNNANAELQSVLAQAPGQFASLGAVLDTTTDPITGLVNNFVAITKAAQLRTPAMRALFPALELGGAALGVPAHDNEFHTILDIWLRPYCQYQSTPASPQVVSDGTMPKWNYCENPPPGQQIRGAVNAPRPNVPNNGSHMPPGVDPNERTMPPVR
ncbi:MlaD family protein [Nocardia cyriacigeorgica]|uniref:Virulence factor Mce family protein n=1 Tax=Nocardia cyriacigeorgica TaxID=135487 RepID=A0A4U8WEZ8_9NOCA|nr:MlaD family protein [Nocardia cyriacigeorgica]MBF6086015.1 MCE family protein [Nocardia cyriacigeorgica]MBF6159235.1 MCE family protein [Nocardia cyriacigeorgica]MBF6198318.1 MCE family protein [Nocardia cyriacigeorgica]MBF6342872.1 MCE family protein [Nocardia cyriacigeorgica]VFB00489.1 virulence factor Mce family protein [Nocardia cyriacigeorgica]